MKNQELTRIRSILRGFNDDLSMLVHGIAEEAGECAKAYNWYHNNRYIKSPKRLDTPPDNLEHELVDVLIYCYGVANVLDFDLDEAVKERLS